MCGPQNELDGSVIIEAGPDKRDLIRRLSSALRAPGRERFEIIVVCLEKDLDTVEAVVQAQSGSCIKVVPVSGVASDLTVRVLPHVRTGRVAFLPAGGTFSDPLWARLPPVEDVVLPWVPPLSLPMAGIHEHPEHTLGWLAPVALLRKLATLGPPAQWRLEQLTRAAREARAAMRWLSAPAGVPPIEAAPVDDGGPALTENASVLALVPHYRCEAWLEECLASLVSQSRPLDGIVVIDDGSAAPPVDIVRRFPQVTLLAAAENVGPFRLMQTVIDATGYDAYLFQDADDWSAYDRLAILLTEAQRTGAELVGSQEIRISPGEGKEFSVCYPLDVNSALVGRPIDTPLLLGTGLVARTLIRRLGGFVTALRLAADSEFLQRAGYVARSVNVPYYCYFRRIRPDSLTNALDTGLRSRTRARARVLIWKRATENALAAAMGKTPRLEPYAVAAPVQLRHLLGPQLRVEWGGETSRRTTISMGTAFVADEGSGRTCVQSGPNTFLRPRPNWLRLGGLYLLLHLGTPGLLALVYAGAVRRVLVGLAHSVGKRLRRPT